jgi:hypothetical protein
MKVVGPNDVITNHGIERGDHLAHDRNDITRTFLLQRISPLSGPNPTT